MSGGGQALSRPFPKRDIVDKLNEIKIASGGRIIYKTIHLEAGNLTPPEQSFGFGNDKDEEKEKG